MRKVLKALSWLAGIVLVLALLSVAALWLLLDSGCSNDVLKDAPSPDGKHKAIVFQRDCGATTGFSTQVSVLRASQSLGSSSGNIFVADTNHGAAPHGPGGGPAVRVTWTGPGSMTVSHHSAARVFAAEPELDGVRITYKAAAE